MTTLTKDFYRDQKVFQYRQLEKTLNLIDLNDTQSREITRIVDEIVKYAKQECEAHTPTKEREEQ